MPRYRPSSLRDRADSRQVPEKLGHRHRILRGRNDVSESGPPNSETHARRLRDKANREVESTTYESKLLIVNGMACDVRDRSAILSNPASRASILSTNLWRFVRVSRILASATPSSLSV